MAVVVTVTQPGVTVTVTPTSSSTASSALPAGTIAGIVIGCLLGGVLFVVLVLYLLNRYRRRKFSRVANPTHERVSAAGGAPDLRHLPSTSSRRPKFFTLHSQRPSMSTEPLMSNASLLPLPFNSLGQSSSTSRSGSITPGIEDGRYRSYGLGEIGQVTDFGVASRSAVPGLSNIPPIRKPEQTSLRSGLGDTPPHAREPSGDNAPSPSISPKPQSELFIHRMLRSRARASEGVSLSHHPSLGFAPSRSTTQDSSGFHVDEEHLLVEAERTALRDAENDQTGGEKITPDEDDWEVETAESTPSVYSQISAPIDHSEFFSGPASRQNSSPRVLCRNPFRNTSRTPAPPTELTPVAEVPDTPSVLIAQSDSRRVSTAANSSIDAQVLHGTAPRPMPSVIDQPGALPLLASVNFGKDSTASGTPLGSISSTVGRGSGSGSGASRYPSLATSSAGQSSQSGPHSDAGTDWRHPPSGLASLTLLHIGPLQNPHSPVEEQPEPPDVLLAPQPAVLVPVKRAHLRQGTASSIPEVKRRTMIESGIVHIEVAL